MDAPLEGAPLSAPTGGSERNPHADFVITDADVWTGTGRWAHGVALHGDRIVAVTDEDAELRSWIGPRTEVIPRPGALVIPGFQDAHIHAPFAGRNRLHVFLNDLHSRPDYLGAIAHYAMTHPEEEWIIGGGWAMEHFPGGNPRKEDLDAVVADRPVFLMNRDIHGAWVNSRALEVAGIDATTPDPPDGLIVRDPDGTPTGTLHEGAAYRFQSEVLPAPLRADWEAAIRNAQEYLHSLGITAWQDAWVTPQTQAAYQALAASGELTARVVGAQWWDRYQGLEQIAEFLTRRETGAVGNFAAGTVKIMTDGVIESQTAALTQPYCDGCGGHTDNYGLSYVDRELLAAAVTQLDAHGFQVHMHAIGDRAVQNALDAVAAARATNGPTDLRHHIAHLQLVRPEDIPRFARLGVVANCQSFWAQSEPQMDELTIPFIGRDRAQRQYPFADLLAAGTVLAGGSDWSVTTADPLLEIEVMVNRIDPDHRANPPFLPEQRVPLAAALAAFTSGSAYVNHDDAGLVEVGRRADLAILDRNIFTEPVTAIGDARVITTFASGRPVFGG